MNHHRRGCAPTPPYWRRPAQHSSCALRSGEVASPDLGGQRKCWCTLWSRRPTPSRSCQTSCGKQRTVNIFSAFYFSKLVFFKFYLETKWVLSGEKATLRTQDPCPLSVPAKLACCLQMRIFYVDLNVLFKISFNIFFLTFLWITALKKLVNKLPARLTHRIFWCNRRRRRWPATGSRGRKWGIWWAWRDLNRGETSACIKSPLTLKKTYFKFCIISSCVWWWI